MKTWNRRLHVSVLHSTAPLGYFYDFLEAAAFFVVNSRAEIKEKLHETLTYSKLSAHREQL